MPATKEPKPATLDQLLQPRPVPIDLDAHQKDMARRQAEYDALRPELLKCLNPEYAAGVEINKPVYHWEVSGEWIGLTGGEIVQNCGSESVVAQNESDAWAAFCDKLCVWPSRRDCKPIIKRGKQLTTTQVAALGTRNDGTDGDLPIRHLGAKPKSKRGQL